jgi:hypothetical protein
MAATVIVPYVFTRAVQGWDAAGNRVEELIALCSNSLVAKGAYQAALRLRPGANLVLSHRTRIIARARG